MAKKYNDEDSSEDNSPDEIQPSPIRFEYNSWDYRSLENFEESSDNGNSESENNGSEANDD